MKYFQRVADNLDVMPILMAVQMNRHLWNQHTLRTTHEASPHTQVEDIWIRFNDLKLYQATGEASAVVDEHESIWYPAADIVPCKPLIFDLMRRFEAERLGRVLITKLAPGKSIAPHEDGGSHAAYYRRMHILLQCLPGALFRCGDETVQMKTGDCWWFDNSVEHEVINNSADDRLTMIVDVKTR